MVVAQAPVRTGRSHQIFQNSEVTLTAIDSTLDKNVYHLKGGVVIKTESVIVMASEATYELKTGEIEARGVVRIQPAKSNDRSGISQFGIK